MGDLGVTGRGGVRIGAQDWTTTEPRDTKKDAEGLLAALRFHSQANYFTGRRVTGRLSRKITLIVLLSLLKQVQVPLLGFKTCMKRVTLGWILALLSLQLFSNDFSSACFQLFLPVADAMKKLIYSFCWWLRAQTLGSEVSVCSKYKFEDIGKLVNEALCEYQFPHLRMGVLQPTSWCFWEE